MVGRFVIAGVAVAVMLFSGGCDKMKEAKDRAALLACYKNGGYKKYTPKLKALVVTCQDGTVHTVEWLP